MADQAQVGQRRVFVVEVFLDIFRCHFRDQVRNDQANAPLEQQGVDGRRAPKGFVNAIVDADRVFRAILQAIDVIATLGQGTWGKGLQYPLNHHFPFRTEITLLVHAPGRATAAHH